MTKRPSSVPRGTAARRRRSDQRARPDALGVSKAQGAETSLLAAASGSTSLPLSDREAAWDAAAAKKSLSEGQYGSAHFWKDPEGDPKTLAAYKLPFATAASGTLTAVWKGVTAAAGALSGARGGVSIPSGDVAGVKSRIESYYSKAAKKYGDDNLKPPWAASSADRAALLLAYADLSTLEGLDVFVDDDGELEGVGGSGPAMDEFLALRAYWGNELGVELAPTDECANCGHMSSMHEDGTGACLANGCDCEAFEKAAAASSAVSPRDAFERMRETLEAPLAPAGVESRESEPELDETDLAERGTLTMSFEFDPATVALIQEALAQRGSNPGLLHEITGESLREGRLVAAAVELPDELQPSETLPEITPGPAAPPSEIPTGLEWTATFVPEGRLTSDGRAIAPGALDWRELPLSLMAMLETGPGGHEGARLAGRIDRIWREANLVRASGVFDSGEFGIEIARLVGERELKGVSVDLGDMIAEVVVRSDYFDEDGNWAPRETAETEADEEPSLWDLLMPEEDPIYLITKATIGMCTVCPFQAFADATIELAASLVAASNPAIVTVTSQAGFVVVSRPSALTASAVELEAVGPTDGMPDVEVADVDVLTAAAAGLAPLKPPAEWFENPELSELTPLTVTEDGRVYGHAWAWGTCHLGFPGQCVTAPHSETDYTYYLLKTVELDNGELVRCGTITLEAPHAALDLDRANATAHYDNTGLAVADVTFGEDEYGGWFSGALRPDVDAEKTRELRGATISGDWRGVNGHRELIALLAVNVPGFPVPRPALAASGEEIVSMVAAGIVFPAVELTDEQRAVLVALRERVAV